MNKSMNRAPTRIALVALLAVALAGCATTQNKDPLEPLNRKIFGFNEAVDQVLLKPVAQGYAKVTPEPVQTALSNVISNIKGVWSAINLFLQGRVGEGAEAVLRVGVNTTLGLGGVLDVATEMGIPRTRMDFGQTLGRWGVPSGPDLVLPLLVPSSVRDATGTGIQFRLNEYTNFDDDHVQNSLTALDVVDTRASLLSAEKLIQGDKYIFIRNAYLQNREFKVKDGEVEDDF